MDESPEAAPSSDKLGGSVQTRARRRVSTEENETGRWSAVGNHGKRATGVLAQGVEGVKFVHLKREWLQVA